MCLVGAALWFTALWNSVVAVPHDEEIQSLPGLEGKMPSRMFSGFLDSTKNGKGGYHVHYWFVESQGNPETDPVVIWFNGGPGASSLFGLMTEFGPLKWNDESTATAAYNKTKIPTPMPNPYAWTKVASILAMSSPPPVGFSWCDQGGPEKKKGGYSCGDWDDNTTAEINYVALKSFLKKFPEFTKQDLYVFGESYAGVYVPTLMELIVKDKSISSIKGFAVGDPCIGTEDMDPAYYIDQNIEFFYGHGQFSTKLRNEIKAECRVDASPEASEKRRISQSYKASPACIAALKKMKQEIGGYFAYNLYDECWGQNNLGWKRMVLGEDTVSHVTGWVPPRKVGGALNDYACGGPPVMLEYLNISAVKKALNVPDVDNFIQFDNGVGFVYKSTAKRLLPFYKYVATQTNLRIMVYDGDTDPSLNSFYVENYTASLALPEKESWRPWTLDGKTKMGGYVTSYEGPVDVITIRGAGHMVPTYQPHAAFEFFKQWVRNEPLKPFVASPSLFGRKGQSDEEILV